MSEAQGAHSISDFARLVTCQALAAKDGNNVTEEIQLLHSRLEELDEKVTRLSQLIGR